MFAIIETGGKQILVEKDMTIFVEKLDGKEGDKVSFDKVLMLDKKLGKPYVSGASVEGVIEKQGKQKKIVVYRHNAKSTHKRKYGHRQPYTRIKITSLGGATKAAPKAKVEAAPAAEGAK